MRHYETLFIINPDLEESEITKTIEIIQDTITTGGGTILKIDRWGRRSLSYQIQKKREGYYVLMYFEMPPAFITELHRRYKLTDTIMRYLVVQLRKDQVEDILHSEAGQVQESSDSFVHEDQNVQEDEMLNSETEEHLSVSMEGE